MGFGLFVPEFRATFEMTSSTVGLVSSLGFAGFFIGLLAAQALLIRYGPEAPVITGLGCATLGLAAGVFVAAASAGFAWTPFNDAVHRKVGEPDRPAALSRISTGTSLGIAAAGMAALAMVLAGLPWRQCWWAFAVASAGVLVLNWSALRPVEKSAPAGPAARWTRLLHPGVVPLYLIGFVFRLT